MNTSASRKPIQPGRGTNLPRVADFNEAVVLNSIRHSPSGRSRVELTAETGLSAQTVTNICRRLIQNDLVRESGKQSAGSGKPRRMLRLNPTGRYAIGVHIDPATITYVVLDFSGTVTMSSRHPTPPAGEPAIVLDEISARIDRLIDDSKVDRDRILGVGIAAPGPVDVENGLVLGPPQLPGWRSVPLRDHLREETGLPVLLDKDVIAGTVAEQWIGGETKQSRNFVFLYLGSGVGAGFIIDDAVIRGISSNAGDVGVLPVSQNEFHDRFTGSFKALWQVTSPESLVREAIEAGALPPGQDVSNPAAIETAFGVLCDIADQGEKRVEAILQRSAQYVASAVLSITNMLDVDTVIFGGAVWERVSSRFLDVIGPIVAREAISRQLHEIRLVGTTLGGNVAAIGAACLVLDHEFSSRPSTLLLT